ncbi:MAG: lipopolysaccharide heptosyltransferase family protein [Verrucomicrobia bacterium]|nr:lipopolysaccharide heptosyltransferase family protein [Verrucomicrobiota bacterium]
MGFGESGARKKSDSFWNSLRVTPDGFGAVRLLGNGKIVSGPAMGSAMKILVIRGGALGDFLLTLPAVAGLRQKWPEAEIELVVAKKFGELVLGPGAVDAVRPIDQPGLAGFYASGGKLDQDWSDYFTEFDLTISYLFDPDGIFAGNWRRAGGTGEYIGFDPRNPTEEAWRYLARPLQPLGIEAGVSHRLYGKELPKERNGSNESKRIVIHPGSGSQKKNWPLSQWVESLEKWRPDFPNGGVSHTARFARSL